MSYERIAGQLNGEGVRLRSGRALWGKTVNNIVVEVLSCGKPWVAPTAAPMTPQIINTAELMLETMRELEPSPTAPVSIRELRAALPGIGHDEFDRVALRLRNERRVFLSRHDFPQGERPEAKPRMVWDGESYFVAITLRGPD